MERCECGKTDCGCRWFPTTVRTLPALTPQQEKVLLFILAFTAGKGYPPSYRDIGTFMFFSNSTNAVDVHIRALVKKGYLSKGGRSQPRTLRVLAVPA